MKFFLTILFFLLVWVDGNAQYFETGIFLKYGKELPNHPGTIVTNPETGNSFTFSEDDSLAFRRETISVGYSLSKSLPKSYMWSLYLAGEYLTYDDGLAGFNELPQYEFYTAQFNLRSELTIQRYFMRNFLFAGIGLSHQLRVADNTTLLEPLTSDINECSDFYFLRSIAQPSGPKQKVYLKTEIGGYLGEIRMLKLALALNYGLPNQNVIYKSEFYLEFGIGLIVGNKDLNRYSIYQPSL